MGTDLFETPRGSVVVLTGPSGVGKDVVLALVRQMCHSIEVAMTATTRPIRPGERDGVDYEFMIRENFEQMIANNGLLEWAEVYGNLYGVPRAQVERVITSGRNVLLKLDVLGAATVRREFPEAVLIFLEPPDMPTLERRLRGRGTEEGEALDTKLQTAHEEMKAAVWFDHRVVNHDRQPDRAALRIVNLAVAPRTQRCPLDGKES